MVENYFTWLLLYYIYLHCLSYLFIYFVYCFILHSGKICYKNHKTVLLHKCCTWTVRSSTSGPEHSPSRALSSLSNLKSIVRSLYHVLPDEQFCINTVMLSCGGILYMLANVYIVYSHTRKGGFKKRTSSLLWPLFVLGIYSKTTLVIL